MDEKELLVSLVDKCQKASLSPVRVVYDVNELTIIHSENGVFKGTEKKRVYSLIVSGMKDGKLLKTSVEEDLKKIDVDSLIKELLKAKGEEYKADWFVKAGARLGKTDSFSNNLNKLPDAIFEKSILKVDNAVKENVPSLVSVNSSFIRNNGMTYLYSSDGLALSFKKNGLRLTATASALGKDKKTYSYTDYHIFHKNLDLLDEKAFGILIATRLNEKLDSKLCPKGKYKAILSPEVASQILLIGAQQLSGKKIAEHQSVYEDSMGKDVFSPLLTILNDPFIGSDFSRPFDGEGTPTEKFMAIDHGRLRCFFLDNQYGDLLNSKTNGCHTENDSCECQYIVVTPSDSNSVNALINEMKDGLLIRNFTSDLKEATSPKTLSFKVGFEGNLYKDGIGKPVHGTVKGKIGSVLKGIVNLSKVREDKNQCLCPYFVIDSIDVA